MSTTRLSLLLLAGLLGCMPRSSKTEPVADSGSGPDSGTHDTSTHDSGHDSGHVDSGRGDTAETGDTAPTTLQGEVPPVAIPLPDFEAEDQLGEARGPSDLTGHPTVMWFYPAAGTAG